MKQQPLVYGALPADHLVTSWYELCLFLGGSTDSFTGDLLSLIVKADPGNRATIRGAYPRVVATWEVWHAAGQPLTAAKLDAAVKRKLQKDALE